MSAMEWYNEPSHWEETKGDKVVDTEDEKDTKENNKKSGDDDDGLRKEEDQASSFRDTDKVLLKSLTVKAGAKTDFWRLTHYGFTRDNGNFYYQTLMGDFSASVRFSGDYTEQYDQSGLMLRVDEKCWIKTGIEYVNGKRQISAVVTRDYSDWSIGIPVSDNDVNEKKEVWLRVVRKKEAVEITYSLDGKEYHLLRLAYLPTAGPVAVGPMCAAPKGEGFTARFEDFTVGPVSEKSFA